MDGQMERLTVWPDRWTNGQTYEQIDGRMDGWIDVWTDGRIGVQIDEEIIGRTDSMGLTMVEPTDMLMMVK